MGAEIANALLVDVQRLALDPRTRLDLDSPLLDGTLDSLALIQLIGLLEERFHVSIVPEEVTVRNFGSVHRLAEFIEARRANRRPGAGTFADEPDRLMRVLVIHPDSLFPPAHGGAKCMRAIAEALATHGAATMVLLRLSAASKADDIFTQQPAALPRDAVVWPGSGPAFKRAAVIYVACSAAPPFVEAVRSLIESNAPDLVLLSEDALANGAEILRAVLEQSSAPVTLFAWTLAGLPFGPGAAVLDERAAQQFRRISTIIVPGETTARYIAHWSGREARVFRFPVFGEGPYPTLADADGPVLFVNPCDSKGLPIALALMREFPSVRFRVVPGWGTTEHDLALLRVLANVDIVAREDGIAGLLEGTSAVLFPSLVDETFPLVPIEAMLHGIPVLGSDIGAVPEAMLGCRHVLPARPLERLRIPAAARAEPRWLSPPQDTAAWAAALRELRASPALHAALSREVAATARAWVASLSWEPLLKALIGADLNAAPANLHA